MRWHARNKEYYMERGYKFTKMKDEFDVKVEDLPPESHVYVKVQCDFCGDIVDVRYQNYNHRGMKSDGYACSKCKSKKAVQSFLNEYGVSNPSLLPDFYEKYKATCNERYGVDHYSSTQEYRDKCESTCMERYGAMAYITSEEGMARIRETNMQKYGTPHPFGNPDVVKKLIKTQTELYGGIGVASPVIRKKIQQTNLQRYGVPDVLQSPEIREKSRLTMYTNGTAPTSKPQLLLNDMLNQLYGNAELNYPCGNCSLDSMIKVDGCKIDVEYDGWYWHSSKEQLKKDYQRDWFVKSQGYKILRIKGHTKIPTEEQIEEAIGYLVKGNHEFSKIIIEPKEKI